ncbi:MAG: hypothetical protein WCA39_02495 [Nitrososphaeraceae archaeon]
MSSSFIVPTQSEEKLDVYCCRLFVVIDLVSVTPLGLRVIRGLTGAKFRIVRMRGQRRNVDLHPDMKG